MIDCVKLNLKDYQLNIQRHCINTNLDTLPYKNTYAWVLANVKAYKTPIPYDHPNGAIIWVNIKN